MASVFPIITEGPAESRSSPENYSEAKVSFKVPLGKSKQICCLLQPQLPRGLLPVTNVILLVTVLVNESYCSNLHESKIIIFLLS